MELSDLGNNVYGSVTGKLTTKELADLFAMAGWTARSSSWTDYQVSNDFAEIEFYGPAGATACGFHGVVQPERADELAEQFAALGIDCSIELYDQDKNLICEYDVGEFA